MVNELSCQISKKNIEKYQLCRIIFWNVVYVCFMGFLYCVFLNNFLDMDSMNLVNFYNTDHLDIMLSIYQPDPLTYNKDAQEFVFNSHKYKWGEALLACRHLGGGADLASIHSLEENERVV